MNKLFKFYNSRKHSEDILKKLEKVGLILESSKQEYKQRIWEFKCKWIPEKSIELIWEQEWWPDGINREDVGISFVVEGNTLNSFEFKNIYESGNLINKITDKVVLICSKFTGKHT